MALLFLGGTIMKVSPFEPDMAPRPDNREPDERDRPPGMRASPDAEGAGANDEEPPDEPGYGHGV
jgi:hypothetical protein